MAEWHYNLFLVADETLDLPALQARLSRELPVMASPSARLLLWGSAEGDRIDFWTDHTPVQLLARFDLRTPSEGFRRLVLEVAREFRLRLVNAEDVTVEATEGALLADVAASAAQAFVLSPPVEEDEEG